MRFLVGLISGAVVMLVLAQILAAPDDRWRERTMALLDSAVTAGRDALSAAPAGAHEPASQKGAIEDNAAPSEEVQEEAQEEAPEDLAGVEDPASQPIPRPPDPFPLVSAEDTQRIVEEVFELPQPPAEAVAETHSATAETHSATAETHSATAETHSATAETRSQVVWVAFHSEMSADGFARRLSAALDHDFAVERRGPGRYEVVFDYRDEPERAAVLSEAAQVTGLPL